MLLCFQTDQQTYVQSVLVSPNFICSTEIRMFTHFDTYVLLLVLQTNSQSIAFWYW